MSKKRRFGWYALSLSIALSLLLYSPPVFGGVDWEVGRDGQGRERDNWGRGRGEGEGEGEGDDPTTKKILSGVPEYFWWYGCAPTAGGMLVGFWDAQPGFENLVYGDISSLPNNTVIDMIATDEHIVSYWGTPDPNPGMFPDNCLADFMHTSRDPLEDGGTLPNDIPTGLKNFAAWDNPATADESYDFNSWIENITYYPGGSFGFDDFRAEIDNGYPMLLGLYSTNSGHAVTAYGYDISNNTFAVWDTWGTEQTSQDPAGAYTEDGVEWWPWNEWTGSEADLSIAMGVYFQPDGGGAPAHTPEPKSFLLIGIGLLVVIGWHKKRHGKRTI